MGIDKESDISANLQIGPTSLGLVRIYVESEGLELPLDFEPDEAEEIAAEIMAAAARARDLADTANSAAGPTARGGAQRSGARTKRRRASKSST